MFKFAIVLTILLVFARASETEDAQEDGGVSKRFMLPSWTRMQIAALKEKERIEKEKQLALLPTTEKAPEEPKCRCECTHPEYY